MPVILRFLGSMNLAIMLLVAIAIASVIGTLLQQNQPYQNYLIKFGPFWHEIYKTLGLYDVYSSAWFVFILAFLVISTSVCVFRHAPEVLRSMRRFREDIHERAINHMAQNSHWESGLGVDEIRTPLLSALKRLGYRTRIRQAQDYTLIAAMKGASNRIGYLLTHIAIVVICIGGLVDGNLPLKLKTLSGDLRVERRDLSVSAIPAISKLPDSNPSFRASVSIPEGARVNYAFINMADGYLLQTLPFSIEVQDFRIEHYNSGQPKSFESDLVIHDPASQEPFETTIAVNHPLLYKGYAIYQASFGDGGTSLQLLLRDFFNNAPATLELTGTVNAWSELETPHGKQRLEFDDFRLFNIFPAGEETERKFVDYGPSLSFKVRQADGTAREYVNYMSPIEMDGRRYFLSGMRASVAEELRYLYLPADAEDSPDRFFRMLAVLNDSGKTGAILERSLQASLRDETGDYQALRENFGKAMHTLLELFRVGGMEGILQYVDGQVPEAEQETVSRAYLEVLQTALREIYYAVLREEGIRPEQLSEEHQLFFDDALNAMNAIHRYGTPFYLQLTDFQHRQATGLQITRAPGKTIVYLGFTMLIAGVFLLFYISHQRLWILLKPAGQTTRTTMAGTRTRHRHEFAREFQALSRKLQSVFR